MAMTPEDEYKIIAQMKDSRRFNIKSIRDWMDLFIKTVTVLSLAGMLFVFTVNTVAPNWVNVPSDISSLATEVGALRVQIDRFAPQIIEYKGTVIVADATVKRGDTLSLTAVIRRNVGCEMDTNVRFFNHESNTFALPQFYVISSVNAPVSNDFSAFTWQITIPENLPTGTYSYFPEIIPVECGVYKRIVTPMSDPFTVI
jgi:hypothetical protein